MPRPAPKTNFFKFFFHTIILLILVNKMTPCALLKNSFQKLKQIRSEKSSLFEISSKKTYFRVQIRLFVPNICLFAYKYVYLFQIYVYLHTNTYICSKYTSICIQIRIFAYKYVFLFQIYVYLHTNTSICSKYTSICIQIRLFVPNIRLCAYKYVYLFQVVLIHEKQRRSQMSSLLEMRWKKPFLSLTNERKRNTGTQLKLLLVFNR